MARIYETFLRENNMTNPYNNRRFIMADDQDEIEKRVLRTMARMSEPIEKEYYCAYCHTTMNDVDRCICCGSRDKRCKTQPVLTLEQRWGGPR
jgi:hypothetical protein